MNYVYGIDIGGTTVKIGLFKLDGTLVRKWVINTHLEDDGAHILKDIAIELNKQEEGFDQVKGVGFGVPGPVKENTVIHAVNLGWKHVDVAKTFKKHLGRDIAVSVHNDANLAALGEQTFGAAKNTRNVVFFTLGTGVGGGIIQDGRIIEGANGAGGEIGHMKVSHHDFRCACGNKGCLETVASATGMRRLVQHYLENTAHDSVLREAQHGSAKFVFELAKEGDEIALAVVNDVAHSLAHAAQILSVITNPEVFVFGGGLSLAGDFLIDKIRDEFTSIAFGPVKETGFMAATLGNDAGIYGAYQAVMLLG